MRRALFHAVLVSVVQISVAQVSGALAGGRPPASPTGFDHPPTNEEIRGRLTDICTGLVAADKISTSTAEKRCDCYAGGVTKAMTPEELDEMRATGKFAPSAEPKARRYMVSCKVKS